MDIDYLIRLLENKLNALITARDQAFNIGDLDRINVMEAEINTVNDTLGKLRLLVKITQVAADNASSGSELVAAGVEAIQNTPPAIPDNAIACLSDYDLSTYAADPLYIPKITDILENMPAMDNVAQIDTYITNEVIGSPVTGQMVTDAVAKYSVDTRLTMAIMELDSRFGTAGVAVSTLNPGNVGNTGTSTQTYNSWPDGVSAVAEWLSRHRVTVIAPVTPASVATSTTPTATSTPSISNATTTPPVIPFINTATTTPPIIPIATTTTPDTTATSTDSIGTSTPPTATSTPPTDASSTPPIDGPIIPPMATTTPPTDASTTPIVIPPDDANATSTPPDDASSTPPVSLPIVQPPTVTPPTDATSTPDQNASSTQAVRKLRVKRA